MAWCGVFGGGVGWGSFIFIHKMKSSCTKLNFTQYYIMGGDADSKWTRPQLEGNITKRLLVD